MKKHNWKKSALAFLLADCMVFGTFGSVLAETQDGDTASENAAVEASGLREETGGFTLEEEEEDEDALKLPVSAKEEEEAAQPYAADEQVRVIIVMDDEAVIDAGYEMNNLADNADAVEMAEQIVTEQDSVVDQIEKEALDGDTLDVRYNFTILTNAVSADVAYGDIQAIREVDGVAEVYIVPQYDILETAEPNTITAGDMVGSYQTWKSGYTGAGQRIAVIDTGIDADHPSFDGGAFAYSLAETAEREGTTVGAYNLLTKKEIESVLPLLNASAMYAGLDAKSLYVSEKIPFAFNYVDQNLDITHDNDGQGDHGTHVSGIACANLYVPSTDGSYAKQENGVVGIAPDAQLITMKVFGTNGGAYPDDYMAAIEDAILLNADAINLSLGSSSAGESADSAAYINEIFDKLQGSSVVVSISAGNAGKWADGSLYGENIASDVNMDTVGSPGSYTNALTVASANNSGYTGLSPLIFGTDLSVNYKDAGDNDAIPTFEILDEGKTGTAYDYVLIDGTGEADDYKNLDVKGKIVLVSRGDITFVEKHENAAAAGAIAMVVYNNVDGDLISMSLGSSEASIPAAFISLADAKAIMKQSKQQSDGTYTGKVTVLNKITTQYDVEDGYTMSDFSSWGVPGSLELKPEITAPGGNIYSTLTDGAYGQMSGTSMAAPSVTGMSALLAQYIKENNLAEKTGLSIRTLSQSLMMSTAVPLLQDEESQIEYSPRNQGAGLANIEKATTSPAYILVGKKDGNDGKVKVELGDDPQRNGLYEFSFEVYNLSDTPQFYNADSSILTEELVDGAFISGVAHKLNPTVEITASGQAYLYDLNKDGEVNKDDAKTLLSYVNGSIELAVVDSYWQEFDFDGNGVVDTADVHEFLAQLSDSTSKIKTASKMVVVEDHTTVNVKITLSAEDRNYLENNFENGMYIDGFIYLKGNVDLSVPLLAFYGNWGDSSMYEPFDLLEYWNNGTAWEYPYNSSTDDGQVVFYLTQYLSLKYAGSSAKYYYVSNMFSESSDEAYLPERNAFSSQSGDSIASINYTLIRNASRVIAAITDADTGAVYYSVDAGSQSAEYYYESESGAEWVNTKYSIPLNWQGTDADGNALSEGTTVNISVTAVPSYYDGVDISALDGAGLTFSVPLTIDNTAPQVEADSMVDLGNNKMEFKVSDNRYVATVAVYGSDKKELLGSYDVNQTKLGETSTITIDYPDDLFYIKVFDYAGNYKMYRVNKSEQPDTAVVTGLTLSQTELAMIKGGQEKLEAVLEPVTVVPDTVTWKSSDEAVATVDANGIVTAVGAGEAVITAITDALAENEEPLTADCAVTVEAIDVDLNSVLWDENGEAYWSAFNTGKLPAYTKLSEAQDNRFMSAVMRSDGKIVAATYGDENTQKSDLYLVDPADGYSATLLQTGLYWCTDMTYNATLDIIWASYGPYLQLIDAKTGESAGFVYLATAGLDDYLVGVADAGVSEMEIDGETCDMDMVYLVTATGNVYIFGYDFMGNSYLLERIDSTGISTDGEWWFNSLTYDADSDYLFWSKYAKNSNEAVLYALKDVSAESTYAVETYELGSFPEGVWPVSGLYEDGTASPSAQLAECLKNISIEDRIPFETVTDIPKLEATVTGK